MEKVIRNGKVAVIISPQYGGGWYSWNSEHKSLLFHPKIVEMIEQDKREEIDEDWVEQNLGIKDVYCGGAKNLKICWLPEGAVFQVDEHDGYESLTTMDNLYFTA